MCVVALALLKYLHHNLKSAALIALYAKCIQPKHGL
jgi:hypothetical protein